MKAARKAKKLAKAKAKAAAAQKKKDLEQKGTNAGKRFVKREASEARKEVDEPRKSRKREVSGKRRPVNDPRKATKKSRQPREDFGPREILDMQRKARARALELAEEREGRMARTIQGEQKERDGGRKAQRSQRNPEKKERNQEQKDRTLEQATDEKRNPEKFEEGN